MRLHLRRVILTGHCLFNLFPHQQNGSDSGMPCPAASSAWQSWNRLGAKPARGILRGSLDPTSRFTLLQRSRPFHNGSDLPERTSHAKLQQQGTQGSSDPLKVRIQGLVRSIRKQKKVAFANIADGSTYGPVQAVISPDKAARYVTIWEADAILIRLQSTAWRIRGPHRRVEGLPRKGPGERVARR